MRLHGRRCAIVGSTQSNMTSRRLYKSGTVWCWWRWTDVPSNYIVRLHIVKTPWFAVCVHWLNHPDPEPWLHDHPVTFLSLILRGGYWEDRNHRGYPYQLNHRWFNFITAAKWDRHTITKVLPNTVTLALMGPKRRDWGYHTPEGWVPWQYYNREKYKSK